MTEALPSPAHHLSDRLHYLPIGIGASLAHALLMMPGYHDDDGFQTTEWFSMLFLSLVVSTAVFTLAVPHGGATTAVVLGAVAVLTSVPFWTMLSLPLVAGAGVVGLRARHEESQRSRATVALGLAALAAVASLTFIIGDMIHGD